MRITYNCYVINQRFKGQGGKDADQTDDATTNPLWGILPNAGTLVALAFSGLVCKTSEVYVYEAAGGGSVLTFLLHIVIGGVCFLGTVIQILVSEPFLWQA